MKLIVNDRVTISPAPADLQSSRWDYRSGQAVLGGEIIPGRTVNTKKR